jgi:hypothetical protein
VTLFPRGFNGRGRRIRHGVYATGEDEPSLALCGNMLPFLIVFGGDAAQRVVEEALREDAPAYLPIERWHIEARPSSLATHTTPPGTRRLIRVHCVFELWPYAAAPPPALQHEDTPA